MRPERFESKTEEVASQENWVVVHSGTVASAGLRVAILEQRMKTRILAADTDPSSETFIDNQPQVTRTLRCEGGGTTYVDALPLEELEQFEQTEGLTTLLGEHRDAVTIFTEAGYDLDDIGTASEAGVWKTALPVAVEQTGTRTKAEVGSGDGTWLPIE